MIITKTDQSDDLLKNSPSLWNKIIPKTNLWFLTASTIILILIDLPIAIISPELRPFGYLMLAVFGIFIVFFLLENRYFKKIFVKNNSILDKLFYLLIFLRNIIFLLNFMPYIQLIGLVAIVFGGPIVIIIYLLFLFLYFYQRK